MVFRYYLWPSTNQLNSENYIKFQGQILLNHLKIRQANGHFRPSETLRGYTIRRRSGARGGKMIAFRGVLEQKKANFSPRGCAPHPAGLTGRPSLVAHTRRRLLLVPTQGFSSGF